jgi:WD40 repeat protein/serine/threonine protein kinase
MSCPDRQSLERLLAGQLSVAESEALAAHGEECDRCLELLAELSDAAATLRLQPAPRRTATSEEEPSEAFLKGLLRLVPPVPWRGPGLDPQPYQNDRGPGTSHDAQDGNGEPCVCPRVQGYEVLSELGRGGMGVVYRARQIGLNRLVALKMVLAGSHATVAERARFRTEAEAAAGLQHPNIVQIYDIGEQDGQPYLSMELVHGPTLAQACQERPQPADWAARLIETLARAIHSAHEQGIVHRDLKPANILLSVVGCQLSVVSEEKAASSLPTTDSRQPTTTPKITDFGLAKRLDELSQTRTGVILGTPAYMAPEQACGKGRARGPAVDIYALGAILFELLTGRPPFAGDSWVSALARVAGEEPIPPRRLQPRCPQDLETICLKCLEKEPARRYASARELAEDLSRFLTQQPIAARPPSTLDRWCKFARRNKALVGGSLGIALALVLGSAVSLLFAVGELRQRKIADANTQRADENARQMETAHRQALHEAYRARLAATLLSLGEHDFFEAAQHLDAAPIALRGWEWKHLQRRILDEGPDVKHWPKDCEGVLALMAVGPDVLAVGLYQHDLRLFEAHSGSIRSELPAMNYAGVAQTHDGPLLLMSRPEAPLSLVGAAGQVRQTRATFGPKLTTMTVNQDGTQVAAAWDPGGAEDRLEIRDLSSGEVLRLLPGVGQVNGLAFSPDGTWLAAACSDHRVRLWQLTDGGASLVCRGHTNRVLGVAFRPDGQCLLSWGDDGAPRQWRVPDGQALDILHGHDRPVYAAAYSADGQWIVSGGADHTVRLWPAAGGEAVAILHGHNDAVLCVAFHPDGSTLVSSSLDGTVRFWPSPVRADPHVLHGHTSYVYPVAYSPDGRWFASGGWDNVIRLWDAASGEPIAVLRGPKAFVACLAISPDGTRLVARSMDGRLRLWETGTGTLLADVEDGGLISYLPQTVAIGPDGAICACGCHDRIRSWELATGQERPALAVPIQTDIRLVVFSPDGQQLAVAATEPALYLVDRSTGQVLHVLHGHTGLAYAASFSPDGRRLVTAGDDLTVRLWNTATGALQQELHGHTAQVFAAAFHPDGTRVASAGRDRVIRIWDTTVGDELARLRGHTDYVFSLAFSPDGSTLVSGSGDHTVRLWDTVPLVQRRAAGEELRRLRPEAERLVEQLLREEGTMARVVRRLRAAGGLSDPFQRAAWHAVLRRTCRQE